MTMTERILAVDDDAGMRRVLERTLSGVYSVDVAASMAEARECLSAAAFDIVLVDIQLGDGDGYTLCREIKRDRPDTDVILITGSLSEPGEKLYRSLEEGAFYFLFKPFERRVLRALVDRCFELRRARHAEAALTKELSDDLERARRFQRSLNPKEPVRHAGWHVEGRFNPCDALGGDFYVSLAAGDAVVVALSDIVGHGVRAAMYAGMLQSVLNAARRRSSEPRAVLNELVDGIEFFEMESYASLVYGRFESDGRLHYFNAGHPPPLCLRSSGKVESLETTALILTPMLPQKAAEIAEVTLEPGERLVMFSDGMYEVLDDRDREWGLEGLTAALRSTAEASPSETLDAIMERLLEHAGGRPLADDATVVLVERFS
jgi:sigma-B regulation protein RsbU (phosphoserine phosphatase)